MLSACFRKWQGAAIPAGQCTSVNGLPATCGKDPLGDPFVISSKLNLGNIQGPGKIIRSGCEIRTRRRLETNRSSSQCAEPFGLKRIGRKRSRQHFAYQREEVAESAVTRALDAKESLPREFSRGRPAA